MATGQRGGRGVGWMTKVRRGGGGRVDTPAPAQRRPRAVRVQLAGLEKGEATVGMPPIAPGLCARVGTSAALTGLHLLVEDDRLGRALGHGLADEVLLEEGEDVLADLVELLLDLALVVGDQLGVGRALLLLLGLNRADDAERGTRAPRRSCRRRRGGCAPRATGRTTTSRPASCTRPSAVAPACGVSAG